MVQPGLPTPSGRFEPAALRPGVSQAVIAYGQNFLNGITAVEHYIYGGQPVSAPFELIDNERLRFWSTPIDVTAQTIFAIRYGNSRHTIAGPLVAGGVPPGRGAWRILIAERQWQQTGLWRGEIVGEVLDARSVRLEQSLNRPATFRFTVDGHSPTALFIRELAHEVLVWRWNEDRGVDEAMFRGIITQSQDILSEQRHTINFTAHDYLAKISRRFTTTQAEYQSMDQDLIATALLDWATNFRASGGFVFRTAARLPVEPARVYADGALDNIRGLSGRVRDRLYPAQTNVLEAIDNLANVLDGYDYDIGYNQAWHTALSPNFVSADKLRIFYPYRGIPRYDWAFVYGATVSSVSRSVNSAQYANYVRVVGMSEPDQPQRFAEAWNTDANDIITNPAGLWTRGESAADVTEQATLVEKAAGTLEEMGFIMPSYTLGIRPGAYSRGSFDIGDQVPLRIASGRLDVDTWVRVLSLTFILGDDGEEDVEVEVGRPLGTFVGLIRDANQRISALERR